MSNNLLKEEIESYVESKRDLWSPNTCRSTRYKLNTLSTHWSCPDRNFKSLKHSGLGRYTLQVYFVLASQFEQERFGTKRYAEFIKKQRAAFKNCYREKTRRLKQEEYERFCDSYRETNVRMFNLLILMGEAGLRVSEAESVRWENFKDGYLWVVGKGQKQRCIPFNVEKLIKHDSNLVINHVAYRFFFKRDLKPFTPHDFRAFFATKVANHPELGIKDAAFLLGHSNVNTTQRYVRVDMDRIARVLK